MGRIHILHLLVSFFIIILLSHLAYFAHYLSLTMTMMNLILLSLSLAQLLSFPISISMEYLVNLIFIVW